MPFALNSTAVFQAPDPVIDARYAGTHDQHRRVIAGKCFQLAEQAEIRQGWPGAEKILVPRYEAVENGQEFVIALLNDGFVLWRFVVERNLGHVTNTPNATSSCTTHLRENLVSSFCTFFANGLTLRRLSVYL